MIAAPFSAIMMVGALVLVELTAGMMEASMMRNASNPMHPQFVVDHRHCMVAHQAAAASVVDRRAVRPGVIQQLVVAPDAGARQLLGHHVLCHGGRREQPAHEFEAAEHRARSVSSAR
jgi:hypothetical protein